MSSGEDEWAKYDSWTGIHIGNLEYEIEVLRHENRWMQREIIKSGLKIKRGPDEYRFYDTEKVDKLLAAIQSSVYLRDDCQYVIDAVYEVRSSLEPPKGWR